MLVRALYPFRSISSNELSKRARCILKPTHLATCGFRVLVYYLLCTIPRSTYYVPGGFP